MTSLDDKLENLAVETPKETGSIGMVLWQTALGLVILLTSIIIFVSCGATTWEPSFQYTL